MELLSPNSADAMAFSHLELFLELLLARKYDIISHASYLPPSLTNKMFYELDSSSLEFSDTWTALLDSFLNWKSSVSEMKLRIVMKK